jgi:hypothetical protein
MSGAYELMMTGTLPRGHPDHPAQFDPVECAAVPDLVLPDRYFVSLSLLSLSPSLFALN